MKIEVNAGDKYNHITIIKELEQVIQPAGKKRRVFLCKCDCGNIKSIRLDSLRKGSTKSCGCLLKETARKQMTTHGLSYNRLYKIYSGILDRCNNKNNKHYKNYGGRGIECTWKSVEEFITDMKSTYKEGLTIERNNNDGNYCKENCSWKTRTEQLTNRRNTIKYKGITLKEWCNKLGLNRNKVYMKIYNGTTINKALGIQ